MTDVLPGFAEEMEATLTTMNLPLLASQVDALEITWRCRCGDAFCTSFYTGSPPVGSWGPGHQNIPLDVEHGMVILDVVGGEIRYVEVLDRPEIRKLIEEIPTAPPREDH